LPPIKRISEELSGISTSVSVKERPLKTVGEQQVQRALKAHVLDRAIAGAIDYIIWFILWIGLLVVSAMVGLPLGIPLGLSSAIIVGWLYFALMEASKKQATLGKIILGLTVVDTYGNKISFLIATKRFFLKLLSTAALGLGLLPIFGGRTMHDNVSGTKVVKPL